jgi:hypothetical protein
VPAVCPLAIDEHHVALAQTRPNAWPHFFHLNQLVFLLLFLKKINLSEKCQASGAPAAVKEEAHE